LIINVVEGSEDAALPITKSQELKWSKAGWEETELEVVKLRVLVKVLSEPEFTKLR
jgi:hypothetical protein